MPDLDAVVIGAGPNGLVAANRLADAGWSVLVLEAAPEPGGAVRSGALLEPGFVNDSCSAFYPFAGLASPIAALELERWGLRWRHAPDVLAHPAADGTCPVLSRDLDRTAASLDRLGPGDGDAWRELYDEWLRVAEPLVDAVLGPFPPARAVGRLATALRGDLVRFARFALLPVRRLGEERFAADGARRLLAGLALHADLAPENALSGFYGFLLAMAGQQVGFPFPEGGAGNLTRALVRRLEAGGGVVLCDHRVRRVVVRRGRAVAVRVLHGGRETEISARRAILADVDAPTLYRRLLDPADVPAVVLADIDRFHWDHATVKVDWNLDRPVPWSAVEAANAGTVHLADGVDALTLAEAQLSCGVLPVAPFVLVGQQAVGDPTRQPPGTDTVWAYSHVPRRIRGDALGELVAGPDGRLDRSGLERYADRLELRIEALAPGFRDAIRCRLVTGPGELEAHDANLVGGAIAGGTTQLHQQLVFRPVPGTGRPETPVAGLYLASSSAHPGGGVHGACGANAAEAALHQRRSALWRRAARSAVASGVGGAAGTALP